MNYKLNQHPNFGNMSQEHQDFIEGRFQDLIDDEVRIMEEGKRLTKLYLKHYPEHAEAFKLLGNGGAKARANNLYAHGVNFINQNS